VSNVGDVFIEVTKHGGGIRRTQYAVAVEGECPACGADLSEHTYRKSAIIDGG
jgi:hypothetical protein